MENNEIIESLKLSAFNIQNISEQMGVVNSKLKDLEDAREDHEMRIKYIEDNERISRSQAKTIHDRVIATVNEILGIAYEGGKVSDKTVSSDIKYRGGFIARCYVDAKNAGVMEQSYHDTPKCLYRKCLEYIEAWTPQVDGGTEAYKRYLDIRREERRQGR